MERGERGLSRPWAVKIAPILGTDWATLMAPPGAAGLSESVPAFAAPAPPSEWERLPEVSAALAAMLAEIGVPLAPQRLTALAQKTLRDISALGRALPFEERLAIAVSEVRSRQLDVLE